jgi:hypothetical protein
MKKTTAADAADSSDPNPALRAELIAAQDVLEPQIDGLSKWQMIVSLSPGLLTDFGDVLAARQQRITLIIIALQALDAVVIAIDNLKADGYPALEPMPIVQEQFDEAQRELANLETALQQLVLGTPETGDFNPESSTRS